jgi:hypothetical protein
MLPRPAWANATETAQRKRTQTEKTFRAILTVLFLRFMKRLPKCHHPTFNGSDDFEHAGRKSCP